MSFDLWLVWNSTCLVQFIQSVEWNSGFITVPHITKHAHICEKRPKIYRIIRQWRWCVLHDIAKLVYSEYISKSCETFFAAIKNTSQYISNNYVMTFVCSSWSTAFEKFHDMKGLIQFHVNWRNCKTNDVILRSNDLSWNGGDQTGCTCKDEVSASDICDSLCKGVG